MDTDATFNCLLCCIHKKSSWKRFATCSIANTYPVNPSPKSSSSSKFSSSLQAKDSTWIMLFVATKKHRIFTVHLPATKLLYNNFDTAAFVFKIYEQQIPPIKLLLLVLYNLRQKHQLYLIKVLTSRSHCRVSKTLPYDGLHQMDKGYLLKKQTKNLYYSKNSQLMLNKDHKV